MKAHNKIAMETTRLCLPPLQQQHVETLRHGMAVFTKQFGFSVAEGAVVLQPESKDAVVAAEWDSFPIVQRAEQMVIGMCACRKVPDAGRAVEIAYGIAPIFRTRD